jgi:hypothetical protein
MKKVIFLFCCLLFISCCKENIIFSDLCPACTSYIEVNSEIWPSKPTLAWFLHTDQKDTFFTFEISEVSPRHDEFADILIFWQIPYAEGEFRFDSMNYYEWNTSVTLSVQEHNEASATQLYFPLKNGDSLITVKYLNKHTGAFTLSFHLILYPDGIVGGQLYNSTYSDMLVFTGEVQGLITDE